LLEISRFARTRSPVHPADIIATRAYRTKTGFGVNAEQELIKNVGAFARLGWSDGKNEAWTFADVDRTATLGLSLKGEAWGRAGDTLGIAGVINAISNVHREFLAAGGTGILAGDGALNYGTERDLETHTTFESRTTCASRWITSLSQIQLTTASAARFQSSAQDCTWSINNKTALIGANVAGRRRASRTVGLAPWRDGKSSRSFLGSNAMASSADHCAASLE
jgi:hypothetical protein